MVHYYYILTNEQRSLLHTGVTKDIFKAMAFYTGMPCIDQQKACRRLVWYEKVTINPTEAIERYQALVNIGREGQEQLINAGNPDWDDLAA